MRNRPLMAALALLDGAPHRLRGRDPQGPVRVSQARQRPQGRPLEGRHRAHRDRDRLLQHRLPQRAQGPHRLRAFVRTPDVPGLEEPGQDGVRAPDREERRGHERVHPFRFHELLPGGPREHRGNRAVGRGRSHEGPRHRPGQSHKPAGSGEERGQGQRLEPALRRFPLDRHAHGREHELAERAQLLWRSRRARRRHPAGREGLLRDLLRSQQCGGRGFGRHRSRPDPGLDQEVLRTDQSRPPCPRGRTSPSRTRPRRSAW